MQTATVRLTDHLTHERAVWRAMWRMSWPSVLSAWLKSSFMLADTLFAGRISTTALAGMSAAVFFVWMFHSLSLTNSIGALSLIAQAKGRGDEEQVRATFRRTLVLGPALGFVVSVVMGLAGPSALTLLGLDDAVLAAARAYLVSIAVCGVGLWFFDTIEQAFRGTGDARTPLTVTAAFALLNVVLNPVLAFGFGPIPALGLVGIAASSGVTWFGGGFVLLACAYKRGLLRPSSARPPRAWSVWRIGLPTAAVGICFDLIWVSLAPLIAKSGPAALAAVAVGHRLESLSYQTSNGISMACASLVGQACGMRRPDLARAVAFRSAASGFVLSSAWIGLLLLSAPVVIPLFNDDPDVLHYGLLYLWFAGAPSVMQGVELIFVGAFSGTGRTTLPSALMLLAYGSRIPLAAVLAPLYGAAGVFGGIGFTAALSGAAVALAFALVGARTPSYFRRRRAAANTLEDLS